jgi:uncharacterized protein
MDVDDLTRREFLTASGPLLAGDDWSALQELWQTHLDNGDLDAQAYLAYMALWCFDLPEAVDDRMRAYLRAAADSGHADAMYWMTTICHVEGPQRDECLQRAGESGSRGAQRDLDALYATGDWTGPKDPARAVYWYRLAAEREHDDAQYNLGFMYVLGEGTTPDVDEGLHWLSRSAEQGNTSAMRLLSDLYANGYYGVPKRVEEAARWKQILMSTEEQKRQQKPRMYLHDLWGSR